MTLPPAALTTVAARRRHTAVGKRNQHMIIRGEGEQQAHQKQHPRNRRKNDEYALLRDHSP